MTLTCRYDAATPIRQSLVRSLLDLGGPREPVFARDLAAEEESALDAILGPTPEA